MLSARHNPRQMFRVHMVRTLAMFQGRVDKRAWPPTPFTRLPVLDEASFFVATPTPTGFCAMRLLRDVHIAWGNALSLARSGSRQRWVGYQIWLRNPGINRLQADEMIPSDRTLEIAAFHADVSEALPPSFHFAARLELLEETLNSSMYDGIADVFPTLWTVMYDALYCGTHV